MTQIVEKTAQLVGADGSTPKVIVNAGGGTVYYKSTPDVSASTKDGSLTAGQSVQVRRATYIVSASQSRVEVADTSTPEEWHIVGAPGEVPMAEGPPQEVYEGSIAVGGEGAAPYQNSWEGTLSYELGTLGNVRLWGIATNAGSSATIFTLPAGYRPGTKQEYETFTIETNGEVKPVGSQTEVSLEGGAEGTIFPALGAPVADDIPLLEQREPPMSFYKDNEGRVHMRGSAEFQDRHEDDDGSIFTLPVGYRPSGGTLCFHTGAYDTDDEDWRHFEWFVLVHPDGLVEMNAGLAGESPGGKATGDNCLYLDGVSFRADQ